jgi:hypothetical protein
MGSRPCETALEVVASASDVEGWKNGRTLDCTTTQASTFWESASIADRDPTLRRSTNDREWATLRLACGTCL